MPLSERTLIVLGGLLVGGFRHVFYLLQPHHPRMIESTDQMKPPKPAQLGLPTPRRADECPPNLSSATTGPTRPVSSSSRPARQERIWPLGVHDVCERVRRFQRR